MSTPHRIVAPVTSTRPIPPPPPPPPTRRSQNARAKALDPLAAALRACAVEIAPQSPLPLPASSAPHPAPAALYRSALAATYAALLVRIASARAIPPRTHAFAKLQLAAISPARADAALAKALAATPALVANLATITPEQLGSAHESLLELAPAFGPPPLYALTLTDPCDSKSASAHQRKRGGSYYTPRSLVEHLLDSSLEPAINQRLRDVTGPKSNVDAQAALLSLGICDPACGSGNFLIAAAHRLARRLVQIRTSDAAPPDPAALQAALHDVISHCIFGVDIDPLAAELCRAVLHLESGGTLSESELAAAIAVGNPLIGVTPEQEAAGIPGPLIAHAPTAFVWSHAFPRVFGPQSPAHPAAHHPPGFDVVIGNPPFLNQLETATATSRETWPLIRLLAANAIKGYADTAAIFLLRSTELLCPGGRLAFVLPQSVLTAKDAAPIRAAVLRSCHPESLWVCDEHIFAASVFTCAITLRRDAAPPEPAPELARSYGPAFTPLAPVAIGRDDLSREPTWAHLAADARGIPAVHIRAPHTIADFAAATADFRDQFYGLDGFLVEDADLSPAQRADWQAFPPIATTGLVDLNICRWGQTHTTILGKRYAAPRIDRRRMERDGTLGPWLSQRLVPKIILATQTRIIEVFADENGRFVPALPLITIVPRDPAMLLPLAAVLASPVIAALALRSFAGAALNVDAIKLSAKQVLALPMPQPGTALALAAEAFAMAPDLGRAGDLAAARASFTAFGVSAAEMEPLLAWWSGRLKRIATAVLPAAPPAGNS